MIVIEQYHRRGPNVVVHYDHKFLILPVSEVVLRRGSLSVSKENLDAAFDVTPDLPPAVLDNAWRFGIVFYPQVTQKWAGDIGQVIPALSAHDVFEAFRRVCNDG